MGSLLCLASAGTLLLLLQLPHRFDTALLVRTTISHLLRGLGLLTLGLLQLAALIGLVTLALFALLLLVAGGVRLIRALAPRPGKVV